MRLQLLAGACLISFCVPAHSALVFAEHFENTLSAWTGKGGGAHHGQIVVDPLNPTNHVLNFTQLNSAGDIFSIQFLTQAVPYEITFDYLGVPSNQGTPDDLGGFLGVSADLPGNHVWFAGTQATFPGIELHLVDDGTWHQYTVHIPTGSAPFHVMLEDFTNSGGIPGDAYFDSIRVYAVPEVSAYAFMLGGLGMIAILGRRRLLRARP